MQKQRQNMFHKVWKLYVSYDYLASSWQKIQENVLLTGENYHCNIQMLTPQKCPIRPFNSIGFCEYNRDENYM